MMLFQELESGWAVEAVTHSSQDKRFIPRGSGASVDRQNKREIFLSWGTNGNTLERKIGIYLRK